MSKKGMLPSLSGQSIVNFMCVVYGAYSVVGVWSALSVQERNASFIVWTIHSELYVVTYIIYLVEQDVLFVFLVMQITSSTYLFQHGVKMGNRGPSDSSSKYSM